MLKYDDETIIIEDQSHYEEHRYIALGVSSKLHIVVVIHTYPDMDTKRIISARKADPKERKQFAGEI